MTDERRNVGGGIWRMDATMREIEAELMENGGELTPEMEERIGLAEETAAEVADGLQALAAKAASEGEALDKEIKRLQALKKSRQNAVDGLKRYMLSFMVKHGMRRVEGRYCTVSVRDNAESVSCDDARVLQPWDAAVQRLRETLPSWVRLKTEVAKTELKDALKEGREVEGAALVRTQSLGMR